MTDLLPLPTSTTYLIVGAGVHGMSTAWHLAMALEAKGTGSGADIVLLDKAGPGAGATGVACGGVRNFYMAEPMHAILRHSVDVWMSDPVNFGFQQVGYISCGAANQADDYARIHKSQNAVGYHSDLYTGKDALKFIRGILPDFKGDGIELALHEKVSGYAGTHTLVRGLHEKCEQYGVRCHFGVEVTGYDQHNGRVTKVHTDRGDIAADVVILGLGTWLKHHWQMLDLPLTIDMRFPDGTLEKDKELWTYWRLLEGEVYYDTPYLDAHGLQPPLMRCEQIGTPVRDPETGKELAEHVYVYWRYAAERVGRPGLQGGTRPVRLGSEAEVDPYGHANDRYQAEPEFADYFCAALGQLMGRFEGIRPHFKERRNGGIGCHTADNMPIYDWIKDNVYMVCDSNHGFKQTGVGKLVAQHLTTGDKVAELEPFRLERYTSGDSFGVRNSTSPWV